MTDNGFEREVLDRLTKIEAKLDSYDNLKEQVYQNQRNMITLTQKVTQQQGDLLELKDRNKWLARAIAGASISAVIGLVVLYLRLGAGI